MAHAILRTTALPVLLGTALSGAAYAQNAAERAVEEAQAYSGTTLDTMEEAGLMAMLGINVTGPKWEELTGIAINVTEVPFEELFPKLMLEHRAGTGAYDVLTIAPSWIADLVNNGALEPLDPYIEKYGVASEFEDIAPPFQGYQTYNGQTYALLVDGDVHILYYRKDIFEDPDNMAEFQEQFGYELAPPETWEQFGEVCNFITDKYGPDMYGAGLINTGYMHFFFSERFRFYGGKFFDPETMKATVNSEAGVHALTEMVEQLDCQPPGVETWGFGESLSALLSGEVAMTITWPPVARWAQALYTGEEALSWVPESTVVDKIGYALTPGGHPEMAAGILLGVSPNSDSKDAAYLYIQWLASQQESLLNVMNPLGLRDPFRTSQYESEEFRSLWPTAGDYLDTHQTAVNQGYCDLAILNTFQYWDTMGRAVVSAIGGADPQEALDDLAETWDEITEQVGVDAQRAAYENFAARDCAYRED